MNDPQTPAVPPEPAEVTIIESAYAAAADLRDLAVDLPGDRHRTAEIADRISEEVAEIAIMIRSLPSRPVPASGRDWQLFSALASAHSNGEDIGEFVSRGLARLAWTIGGTYEVIANRDGSWEASHVARLLDATVGDDESGLDAYRTTQ